MTIVVAIVYCIYLGRIKEDAIKNENGSIPDSGIHTDIGDKGEEIMRTSSVRESDSTGRHTTTYRQLIELNNGVSIIDTPGMREIGMANTELGIDNTFSDIAKLEKQCKFSDCQHDTEPGCAVKAAIESGDLSVDRYILYKSLSSENTKNYAKKKEISKWAKAAKKIKRDSF